ncbi:phage tail spike protein [Ornithinibacillus sp. JPR2-1]|uniref:phage tail spike protein n=1 Tax=Ornithinibacillus sp. JPR2-1 TaxID=2094019 RepID=UPI0031DC84E0
MAELYIFDQDDNLLTIISEDTGLVGAPVREELNQVPTEPFLFTVEADSENAQFVKEENQVVFRDCDGDLRLYVIKELDDLDNNDGPQTTATCIPNFVDELSDNVIEDRRFTDVEAQTALNVAVQGTRYIGEVEVSLGLASTNFYRLYSIDAIWKIRNTWGGDIKDVVEFDEENNIVARKIKLVQRLGKDHGQRFEIDHNITEIQRTVISYPKTAMYGWGASLETDGGGNTRYIDFADVEWSVAKGDPVDKPKGQKWVGDPKALQKYGRLKDGELIHRKGQYSNHDIEEPEELLWHTWNHLQTAQEPEVNYRLSVDLFDDKVSLGDTAIALDRYFARPIEIQTRVIAIEYDLLDPDNTAVVEMGQFLNLEDNRLNELENEVQRISGRPAKVSDDSYPNIKPSTPVNLKAEGGHQVIQLYWDYADEIYIKHYEVYGSPVKDFVPDSQHLLSREQTSTFSHLVGTDQVWYYRVRAVNYQGTPSDWSIQVSATTHRVISDEILFNPDLAARLRDLNDISKIIGDGGVDFPQISDYAKDMLEQQAKEYTDQEIKIVEDRITDDLNNRIGDVNTEINNLLERTQDIEGTVTTIVRDVNEIDGKLSTTITELGNLDDTVYEQSLVITALADGLSAKAERTEVYTKTETNSLIDQEIDNINIGGRNYFVRGRINNLAWASSNVLVQGSPYRGFSFKVSEGEKWVLQRTESTNNRWGVYWFDEEPTVGSIPVSRAFRDDSASNKLVYLTVPSNVTWGFIYLSNQADEIPNIMLEKGNKPSDYSPAPEDKVDLTVYSNKMAQLDLTIDGISTRVGDTEVTINNLTGDITSIRSDITTLDVKADGIITDVSSVRSTVTTHTRELSDLNAQLEIQAGQISSKVDATYVRGAIDDLEIGGRNLIRNSDFSNGTIGYVLYSSTSFDGTVSFEDGVIKITSASKASGGFYIHQNYRPQTLEGQVYTVTIWAKGFGTMRIGQEGVSGGLTTVTINSDDYMQYSHTFTPNITSTNAFSFYVNSPTDGIYVDRVKLEKGNKATDWTPAPEDIESQMTVMSSEISQLADKIELKVNVDDIVATINLSKEGVRIQGNLIHLSGLSLIDEGIIKTAHIENAAITRAKLGTAVVGTAQIDDLAVTSAKIASVNADKINAASLSAISANLGTVTAGRLLSSNDNMDLNLNTGTLRMQNAAITIANGAQINFEDAGNTLTYRKYDSTDNLTRSAGIGVGDRIGNRYPFVYLGTTGASNLNSLSQYFSGFIANSTAATGTDNAANSVNGFIFQMRNRAVGWDKGITYDFNGNPTITMIGGNSFDYSVGPLYQIKGKQAFNIQNYYNNRSGWFIETNYSGSGADITFRGMYGEDYNYQIGGNSTTNAIRNIYLRNDPVKVSDKRAKEDIASNELGLDFINSLTTREFRLKQKPSEEEQNPLQFGFIAQEVISSLHMFNVDIDDYTIIGVGEDGLFNLKETQLIAPTIKAVQELDKKVDDEINWLKVENQLLRNEVTILQNKIKKLEERVA